MRQRAAAFAGVLMVAAVTALVAAVCAGILSAAATTGTRAALESRPSSSLALQSALPLAADAGAQDDAVRAAIRQTFDDAGVGVPLGIVRSVATIADVGYPGGAARTAIVSLDDVTDAAILVAGNWPASAGSVSMQSDAARALGVAPGDPLVIGQIELTLAGTWRVDDGQDPRWLGDPIWTEGVDNGDTGPVIVDEALWSEIDLDPRARWTIAPDVSLIQPSDLAAIETAWDDLPDALDGGDLGSPTQTGRFVRAADGVGVRLHALAAIGPAAGVVVAAVAALALWALGGLLADARLAETALLHARGTSRRRLVAMTAGETAVVGVLGGILGAAIGVLGVAAILGGEPAGPASFAAVWTTVGVAALAAALASARTARILRRSVLSRRARRSGGIAAVVLLGAAAAVSTWQLLTYGAAPPAALAARGVDPVTVAAPALLLAAIVIAGVVAFPLLARASAQRAARSAAPGLAALGVARRLAAAAVPVVLVGVAVGQLAISAGYAATWRSSFEQTQQLASGTALRITSNRLAETDLAAAAAASGVLAIAPVRVDAVGLAGQDVTAVGVAPTAFARLATTAGGLIDPAAAGALLASGSGRPELPGDEPTVTVTISPAPSQVTLWVTDRWGATQRIDLEVDPATGAATGTLSEGTWWLAAVDMVVPPPVAGDAQVVRLESVSTDAGTVVLAGTRWRTAPVLGGILNPSVPVAEPATELIPEAEAIRMTATPSFAAVVVSRPLADRLELRVGETVSLAVGANAISTTVDIAGIVDAIPGGSGELAMLIDSAVLNAAALADDRIPAPPTVAWIGTDDVAAAAASLRSALPPDVAVTAPSLDPDLVMLAAAPQAMWVAAAGCLVLAVTGLGAVAAAQVRARRDEVAVLHAIGMSAREQSTARRAELSIVAGWGAVTGLVAGAVVVLVVVATLARSAIPDADPAVVTPVRFDVVAFTIVGALFALAVAGVVAGYGRSVSRHALRAGAPGEERAT